MAQRPRVLVVDDEPAIVTLLCDFLDAEGFDVLTAQDGAAALAVLARGPVDCVVLDIMMPGPSGFDVCRQIRTTADVPILLLTAREDASDKIRGFRLGADDYVVKATATPEEVVVRVKAVLRRSGRGGPRPDGAAEDLLDFGRLVIDVRAHEVRLDGVAVPMPAREFALLHLLAAHPRQAFSRAQLFTRLWGEYGDESTVTTHIRRLREKIEEDPTDPRYIVTLEGPDAPCPLVGDRHLLTRAVENLVDNALRHTPAGGEIRVSWGAEGSQLVVRVADTGPGIAAQDLPHLFTPLYRGESSRNRQTGGAGLGLAIARRILQAHGGELTAANRAAGGAVFTATLPVGRQAPAPADPVTATTHR